MPTADELDALYRGYVEKALAEVEPFFCEQTGFLHVHASVYAEGGGRVQVVPAYENILYALLLFRRKTVEAFQKGKAILQRVLCYQNNEASSDQFGNFPAILSDFPLDRDWQLPAKVSFALFVLQTNFERLLGGELNEAIHVARVRLQACIQANQARTTFSRLNSVFIAAQAGGSLVEALQAFLAHAEALHPRSLGLALLALNQRGEKFPINERYWHHLAKTYSGPAIGAGQYGTFPEMTVLDAAMSLFYGVSLPNRPWTYETALDIALLPKTILLAPGQEMPKTFTHIIGETTVSACLSATQPSGVRIVSPAGVIIVTFPGWTLVGCRGEPRSVFCSIAREAEAPDSLNVASIYLPRDPLHAVLVDGQRATAFLSTSRVSLASGSVTLRLKSLPEGGFGSVRLGNRHGQKRAGCPNDYVVSIESLRGKIQEWVFCVDIS